MHLRSCQSLAGSALKTPLQKRFESHRGGLFFSVWDANTSGSSHKKHIDYITIATAGNSADFGELTVQRPEAGGFGSSTRGIAAGGYDALSPFNAQDTIDYVTIATTGNASDFGDITVARSDGAGVASPTRGLMVGGETPSSDFNTIDYVTIATTGNASDFGDASVGESRGQEGSSDCHGGLS